MGLRLPRAPGPPLVLDELPKTQLQDDRRMLQHQKRPPGDDPPANSNAPPWSADYDPAVGRPPTLHPPEQDRYFKGAQHPLAVHVLEALESLDSHFIDALTTALGRERLDVNNVYGAEPAPTDPNTVGSPPAPNIALLTTKEKLLLQMVQQRAIRLSSLLLNATVAPLEFNFKIIIDKGAPLLVEPQHHHSAVNNVILRELIREGVQGGLIEPTPEGEPLVACQNHCFPNTGGKTRPCITGRLLNRWTVREPVHNTSIDEVRQRLPANACFFSKVDVRWAFMLLGIDPASRKYTTFYGPDGRHYRYKRMTFGFVNAPAI
jgi:hypothetical protein